jgi:hypothetical protein
MAASLTVRILAEIRNSASLTVVLSGCFKRWPAIFGAKMKAGSISVTSVAVDTAKALGIIDPSSCSARLTHGIRRVKNWDKKFRVSGIRQTYESEFSLAIQFKKFVFGCILVRCWWRTGVEI